MRLRLALVAFAALAFTLTACPKGGDRVVPGNFGTGGGDDKPGAACADDAREEDDSPAYVMAKVSKEGEKFEAMSCPGDDDYIHQVAEGAVGGTFTWNASEGEIRVDLFDASGALVRLDRGTDTNTLAAGSAVVQRLGARGDYYLRVRNRAGTPVKYKVDLGATK